MNAPPKFTMGLTIGVKHIHDLLNPHPNEIDLDGVAQNLRCARRFSNHPLALTIDQHEHLTSLIAERGGAEQAVIQWAKHHDDHEGITGDMPGPLKNIIAWHTPILGEIEEALDKALCAARGVLHPPIEVRMKTHHWDKIAESVEWKYVLGRELQHFNRPLPDWLGDEMAEALVDAAIWQAERQLPLRLR